MNSVDIGIARGDHTLLATQLRCLCIPCGSTTFSSAAARTTNVRETRCERFVSVAGANCGRAGTMHGLLACATGVLVRVCMMVIGVLVLIGVDVWGVLCGLCFVVFLVDEIRNTYGACTWCLHKVTDSYIKHMLYISGHTQLLNNNNTKSDLIIVY